MNSSKLTVFSDALRSSAEQYDVVLDEQSIQGLSSYYEFLNAWNARLHLVAPTSPSEFATRHVLESLTLLRYFDDRARVADVGSGGGLPILPCLIVKRDLRATLIESSKKKVVFLREVLKETDVADRATVVAERFENESAPDVEYITCRAIERFVELIPVLIEWTPPNTKLLLFGGETLKAPLEDAGLTIKSDLMPNSDGRFLFVTRRPAD